MDSLGGILTNGLLGNPILAQFNLFLDITIEEVTPTPTPSPSYSQTPTPTPTVEPPIGYSGGRSRVSEPEKRTVKITIKYKTREYSGIYTLSDGIVRVTINTISRLNVVKEKLHNISLKLKKKEPPTVKVKRHDD